MPRVKARARAAGVTMVLGSRRPASTGPMDRTRLSVINFLDATELL